MRGELINNEFSHYCSKFMFLKYDGNTDHRILHAPNNITKSLIPLLGLGFGDSKGDYRI